MFKEKLASIGDLPRVLAEYFKPSPERAEVIINDISTGSTPGPGYYALISAASVIASLGLVANSPAVVIGAMLVSPLMMPIFGIALGAIRGETGLLGKASSAEIGGVFLAIAFGAAFGLLMPSIDVTPEMLARTKPTLLDLLVAVFAGLAGTLAVVDERISPVLPGVAISTAIVPPLSTCGLCLALGSFRGAYGAFLLFFANFVAILFVSALVFIMAGLAAEEQVLRRGRVYKRVLAAGIGFLLVAAVLTQALVSLLEAQRITKTAHQVFTENLRKEPTTSLDGIVYNTQKGELEILATVRTPKAFQPDRVKFLEDQLSRRLNRPVKLIVRCLLSKDVSATGTTSAVVARRLDGSFLNEEIDPDVVKQQLAEQTIREILADHPEILLLDVSLIYVSDEPVIVASMQSSKPLIAVQVAGVEQKIRERLNDPNVILLVRTLVPIDVTARGRILAGGAHFGKLHEGTDQVEAETRRVIEGFGDLFAPNVDAVWNSDHWNVSAEIVGLRVIRPNEIRKAEQVVAAKVGNPVTINARSRVELMVTGAKFMSLKEYTTEKLQSESD